MIHCVDGSMALSNRDLAERAIAANRRRIGIIEKTLPNRRAENDINGLFMNYGAWSEAHFQTGIILWRLGEDPRKEFTAGLDVMDHGATEAMNLTYVLSDIDQLRLWIAEPIAFLMNRVLLQPRRTTEINPDLPARSIDYCLCDALFDRPYKDRTAEILAQLGARSRERLAFYTAQNQLALLDNAGNSARISELAAEGEALYLKRAKDPYFHPSIIKGGGPDNPLMLDWQLAAILKKVSFTGQSPSRWLWD